MSRGSSRCRSASASPPISEHEGSILPEDHVPHALLVDQSEAPRPKTVRARLSDLGQEIPPRQQQTPEYLGTLHKAEVEKWWPIVKAAGIKAE